MFKTLIEGKKAVFFDLDGTIVDTSAYWEKALGTTLSLARASWIDPIKMYTPGMSIRKIWENKLIQENIELKLSVEELVNKTNETFINEIENAEDLSPVEGFVSFLVEIKNSKGLKTALVTNSRKDVTNALIDKLGLNNAFDLILTGEDVKKIKPDPEILHKAAKELKLKTKEILVFEDSPTGSKAASKAGMDLVIIYNNRFPKVEYKGNILRYFPDFSPLPGHLDNTYFGEIEEAVRVIPKLREIAKQQNNNN